MGRDQESKENIDFSTEIEEEETYKKVVRLGTGLFIGAVYLSLVGLMCGILAEKYHLNIMNLNEVSGVLDGIYTNLNNPYFTSITLATTCPDGSAATTLGRYSGTKGFCGDISLGQYKSSKSDCSEGQTYSAAIDANYFAAWKGYQVCISSVAGVNSTVCPTNWKSCGTGICVNSTICPVTQITIGAQGDSTWTSVQIPDGRYINYKNQENVAPLTGLNIAINAEPACLSPYQYPKATNYPASIDQADGCTEGEMPNVQKSIDSDSALTGFNYQPWASKYTALPSYTDIFNNENAYLEAYPRLTLNGYCTTMDISLFKIETNNFEKAKRVSAGFSITIVALFGVSLILIGILSIKGRHDSEHIKSAAVLALFMYGLVCILTIPASGYTKRYDRLVREKIHSFNAIRNQTDCFADATVNNYAHQYANAALDMHTLADLWKTFTILIWSVLPFYVPATYFFISQLPH